jgi:hypothetical protein
MVLTVRVCQQSHLAGINSNSSINVKNIYYHRLLKVMEIIKQSELVNLKQKVVEKFSHLPSLEKKIQTMKYKYMTKLVKII